MQLDAHDTDEHGEPPGKRGLDPPGRSMRRVACNESSRLVQAALPRRLAMFVGVVRIELHLPGASSLKDKRAVLRSLKDRIRQRAQAAVAEVDHQDLWQRAALGVAVVSGERRQVGELLQSVRQLADGTPGAEVIDWQETLL